MAIFFSQWKNQFQQFLNSNIFAPAEELLRLVLLQGFLFVCFWCFIRSYLFNPQSFIAYWHGFATGSLHPQGGMAFSQDLGNLYSCPLPQPLFSQTVSSHPYTLFPIIHPFISLAQSHHQFLPSVAISPTHSLSTLAPWFSELTILISFLAPHSNTPSPISQTRISLSNGVTFPFLTEGKV